MNPCPCGNATDPEKLCACSPSNIIRYQRKISGPILDRIDIHIEVPRMKFDKLASEKMGESSVLIRKRVIAAGKASKPDSKIWTASSPTLKCRASR